MLHARGDGIQLRRVLVEGPGLDRADARDRQEVEVRRRQRRAQHCVDGDLPLICTRTRDISPQHKQILKQASKNGTRTSQLRAPEQVTEENIIVQPPHPMAPCRLEPVHVLQAPAQAHVPRERDERELSLDARLGRHEPEEREAEQEQREGRLVPRAVVHAREGPERGEQVRLEEGEGGVIRGREKPTEESARFL